MSKPSLTVREIQTEDIMPLTSYWLNADDSFLKNMGADPRKIPSEKEWIQMLNEQISQPYTEKKSYCIIWFADNEAMGHSNVNKIIFGEEAYMHLHIWKNGTRKKGCGTELVKMTLPWFFEKLKLKTLYCEPYALNPAPNRVLEKLGFEFVKEYITTPGYLNFEQPVKHWELTFERFKAMAISVEK